MNTSYAVPAGERLLWRGEPDTARVYRRRVREAMSGTVSQALPMLGFLGLVAATSGWAAATFFLPFIGVAVVVFVVIPLLIEVRRSRHVARSTYLLTDRRLLIRGPDGERNLRLANLGALDLELEGDGIGSIFFSPPLGNTPERYLGSIRRFLPGGMRRAMLLESVPDVERVLDRIEMAQADERAAALAAVGTPDASGRDPVTGQPMVAAYAGAAAEEAPVAQQPMLTSMAIVPLWFGGAFLGMGLLVLVILVATGPAEGTWIGLAVGGGFTFLGAAMVFARLRGLRQSAGLLASGLTTRGTVLDVAGTGVQVNEVEQWVVRYEFQSGGLPRRGQSELMSWERAARYAPGDTVKVRYDPRDVAISTLVESL